MGEATTAGPVLRAVTVVVGPRRHDVVVDENLALGDLLELVAPASGLALFTLAGSALVPVQTVAQARLGAGSVLVAAELDSPTAWRAGTSPRLAAPGVRPANTPKAPAREVAGPLNPALDPGAGSSRAELAAVATAWLPTPTSPNAPVQRPDGARTTAVVGLALLVLAACAGAVVAVVRAYPPTGAGMPWPPVVAGLGLALAGIVLAQFGEGTRPAAYLAPVPGAAAGAILGGLATAYPDAGLVGACAGAALVALAAPGRSETARRVARAWTAFAAGIGAIGLWALAVGAPPAFAAALCLAAVTLVPRIVPGLAIDVEDDVLLDFARLSVTSWSPRQRRVTSRSAWRLDQDAVDRLVEHASVTQSAVLAGVALVSAGAGLALALTAGGPQQTATRWLLAAAAAGLWLTARGFRRRTDRLLLHLAAAFPALALLLPLAAAAPAALALAVGAAAALVGAALALASRGAGRRRPSLTGTRLADAAEGLALVAALPLALWVAGVVDWFRSLLG